MPTTKEIWLQRCLLNAVSFSGHVQYFIIVTGYATLHMPFPTSSVNMECEDFGKDGLLMYKEQHWSIWGVSACYDLTSHMLRIPASAL